MIHMRMGQQNYKFRGLKSGRIGIEFIRIRPGIDDKKRTVVPGKYVVTIRFKYTDRLN